MNHSEEFENQYPFSGHDTEASSENFDSENFDNENFDNVNFDNVHNPETLLTAAKELIDQLQHSESDVEGLAEFDQDEQQPDLYTLLEGLTALRQEISLQGRTFHEFQQPLSQYLEKTQTQTSSIETFMARVKSQEKEEGYEDGFHEAFNFLIDPLLDTHDQFRRMNEQFQSRLKSRKKWLGFFQNTNELKQVQQSVELTLKKLNQRMQTMQIVPVARVGGAFEPQVMKAVELEPTSTMKPDHVVEIFRQGYRHQDRVLRFAEVKVSSSES